MYQKKKKRNRGGRSMSFIVAIDGPAGTGKGTITKLLAEKLNLITVDTGATYRCVTLAMLKQHISLEEADKITKLLENIQIEFKKIDGKDKVFLNGKDVTTEIRSKEVTDFVSQVSSLICVRLKMVELQRKMAQGKDVIMEGRDIGTYVFPNANVKFYIDADVEERAKRRVEQNKQKGIQTSYEEVLANLKFRDQNDKQKEMGALKVAEDAIVIDTTHMSIEEEMQMMLPIIQKRRSENCG